MTPPSHLRPALFLDRDGVINLDHGYVHRWEDFEYVPGIVELIRHFNGIGWPVVVVTNQSGIARGYYSEDQMHALHDALNADLERQADRPHLSLPLSQGRPGRRL
jgi:D-glycero-D-manno-heptose 1,7-bisphosphate phosphatase